MTLHQKLQDHQLMSAAQALMAPEYTAAGFMKEKKRF